MMQVGCHKTPFAQLLVPSVVCSNCTSLQYGFRSATLQQPKPSQKLQSGVQGLNATAASATPDAPPHSLLSVLLLLPSLLLLLLLLLSGSHCRIGSSSSSPRSLLQPTHTIPLYPIADCVLLLLLLLLLPDARLCHWAAVVAAPTATKPYCYWSPEHRTCIKPWLLSRKP
jgi:hypothetical protein